MAKRNGVVQQLRDVCRVYGIHLSMSRQSPLPLLMKGDHIEAFDTPAEALAYLVRTKREWDDGGDAPWWIIT